MNRTQDACEHGQWHLHLWPSDQAHEDADCRRIPFLCRSWRHDGECRLWRGAYDFVRARAALESRDDWVYIVLTFHQRETAVLRLQTYGIAGRCWDRLNKRLSRAYPKLQYLVTMERHQKGGCHMNVVIGHPQLASHVELDWRRWRRNVLRPSAVECGFGPVCWVERVATVDGGLAAYVTKLGKELTGAATKGQIPVDAPPHFRRIRASRGLLPKKKLSDFTGELVHFTLPEYDSTKPAKSNLCGATGTPAPDHCKHGATNATNTSIMAEPGGFDGGRHSIAGVGDSNACSSCNEQFQSNS